MEKQLPVRKPNRLSNYDYSTGGAYFITICTKNRKNLFWHTNQPFIVGEDSILPPDQLCLSTYGKIVSEAISAIPKHYPQIELPEFVVMPNHVHLILLIPYSRGQIISAPTISTFIGQTKRHVSKKIGHPVWQKSFHDHIIRDLKDYEKIPKYIYENPTRWQYDCFYNES